MKKIGLIGTGIMGSGIAANYLRAGYAVNIWNRTAAKTQSLQAGGAKLLESPKAVTEQSDIIYEVTADDASSQAVWTAADGILAAANASKILIASATLSVGWIDQLAQLCRDQELTFFDMPLTGGRLAAESGSLTLLVGGDETRLESLKPELQAISAKIFYFGSHGSGMRYKLVLNSLQASHIAAFGEAMKLAEAQGLSLQKVGKALCDRPGGVVTNLAWEAYQRDETPLTFSVDWIAKDLKYARQMARDKSLPILNDILRHYQHLQAEDHGNDDWTAINKF